MSSCMTCAKEQLCGLAIRLEKACCETKRCEIETNVAQRQATFLFLLHQEKGYRLDVNSLYCWVHI